MTIEDLRFEIKRRLSFVKDELIGQSPEDSWRHYRLIGMQDAFNGLLHYIEENTQDELSI